MSKNDGGYMYDMSLRDYFASKAMQTFAYGIGCLSDQSYFEDIAKGSYRLADAMLAERDKK